MEKEFRDCMAGVLVFATLMIGGIFLSILLSMRAEAAFGADHGFLAGAATLLACWGTAIYALYRSFKLAIAGRAPSRSGSMPFANPTGLRRPRP